MSSQLPAERSNTTSQRRTLVLFTAVLGLLLLLALLVRFFPPPNHKEIQPSPSSLEDQEVEEFFKDYWQKPIPIQGPPPATFTEEEASLRPQACGSCHPEQYADWKQSLHSRAMGPGPWGQIIELTQNSPEEAGLCRSCHAPLGEQSPLLAKATEGTRTTYKKNPAFNSDLELQGITCAACHVRRHRRYGPPKSEEAFAAKYPAAMPNHDGAQRTAYFEKAEFCKGCHQFDTENSLLVNGKLLQDTYREWKNSIWGRDEASCQECHMPKRRHLWKGIHDREWVRGGVRIETQSVRAPSQTANALELEVKLVNAAVGHKFPTYITPKIFIRATLLDGKGQALPATEREKIIGWDARFEGGEWREYFDSRIPPGGELQETFRWMPPPEAKKIRVWVEVHPDHFYHVYFYPAFLSNQELTPQARKLIEKALRDSGLSAYVLFEKVLQLAGS